MHNARVSTKPNKPADPLASKPADRAADFLLDPLPVPEAIESNTDTAWGRWEDTLKEFEDGGASDAHPEFEDTVPHEDLNPEVRRKRL